MDSQHRHELQENALAHWLEQKIEAIKPQLPLILGGVAAAAIAVWGLGLLSSSSASARLASWDAYSIAMEGPRPNLALLGRVAADHGGSQASEWANITLADGQLYSAAQSFFNNRNSASESLIEAKTLYESLRGARDARVRNRATWGLARAADIEGDIEQAKTLYSQVAGAFRSVAQARVEELSTERAAADFAWLADARPAPPAPAEDAAAEAILDFSVDEIETPIDDESTDDPVDGAAGGLELGDAAGDNATEDGADAGQPAGETAAGETEADE